MSRIPPARQALLASLRREVGRLEGARPPEDKRPISTGSPALDRLLPTGGLQRGTVIEYLSPASGSGTGTLALAAAREACREGKALIVVSTWAPAQRPKGVGSLFGRRSSMMGGLCPNRLPTPSALTSSSDPPGLGGPTFYPPAAAAWGIDLSRLIILQPANEADALWALDQALRCPGVGAVWAVWDRLDAHDFRRLQLAAECGGTLGLLLRPARYRTQPTWADVRLEIQNRRVHQRSAMHLLTPKSAPKVHCATLMHPTWKLHVELLRCRGGTGGHSVVLELDESAGIWREATDHAPHSLPLSVELADPAPARRA